MSAPKFKVGEEVYYMRWPHLKQGLKTKILAVCERRFWQLHHQYLVTDNTWDFPMLAKESALLKVVKA